MQFAKDSFYMALRSRLAALNPARTISVEGVTVTAVVVSENSVDNSQIQLPEAYYLYWGGCRSLAQHDTSSRPLFGMDCIVSFWTAGTSEAGVDRGRVLAQLESELMAICHPHSTAKQDFRQSPSVDLGSSIFWTAPALKPIARDSGNGTETPSRGLRREASLTIFFFPEIDLL
jgi:hypothetical protein